MAKQLYVFFFFMFGRYIKAIAIQHVWLWYHSSPSIAAKACFTFTYSFIVSSLYVVGDICTDIMLLFLSCIHQKHKMVLGKFVATTANVSKKSV